MAEQFFTIGKEFHWEMGHRLPFHDGGCRNVHGHSYQMRVELSGLADENGMVVDYFDMKSIIQPIVDQLDHSFLCDTHDEPMVEFFKTNPMKVNYVDFPSTAENLAKFVLDSIAPLFKEYKNLRSLTVRLQETERTFAEVSSVFSHD